MNLIADNNERLSCIFRDDFSSLVLLPKIEKLINKQEPTLEDILGLCSDNASLLEKNTSLHVTGSEAAMRVKSLKPEAENFITSLCNSFCKWVRFPQWYKQLNGVNERLLPKYGHGERRS